MWKKSQKRKNVGMIIVFSASFLFLQEIGNRFVYREILSADLCVMIAHASSAIAFFVLRFETLEDDDGLGFKEL
jgi:divalent metal cation (Fe/Co/Zn/Cd) transporter